MINLHKSVLEEFAERATSTFYEIFKKPRVYDYWQWMSPAEKKRRREREKQRLRQIDAEIRAKREDLRKHLAKSQTVADR